MKPWQPGNHVSRDETRTEQPMEIVIVGLGPGGLYASKSALGFNRKCHVTVIEKRNFDQFSPCGLPYVIEGVIKDFEDLCRELGITIHRMVALDSSAGREVNDDPNLNADIAIFVISRS